MSAAERTTNTPYSREELLSQERMKEPELIALPPLENTTLVLSVPFWREWQNGNVTQSLMAFLQQVPLPGTALELQLVANAGYVVEGLTIPNYWRESFEDPHHATDDEGVGILNTTGRPRDKDQAEAQESWKDIQAGVAFVRQVVEAQKVGRVLHSLRSWTKYFERKKVRAQLDELLNSVESPIHRHILQLAAARSHELSVIMIDGTRLSWGETPFLSSSLKGAPRTFGADLLAERFPGRDDLILWLSDIDTVPASKKALQKVQAVYQQHPDLAYYFTDIAYQPAGSNRETVTDGPRDDLERTAYYSRGYHHGSPQISMRMSTYQQLQEIASWGFQGHEDFDLCLRLIFNWGASLQKTFETHSFSPPPALMLTKSRLDGWVDGLDRRTELEKNGAAELANDVDTFMMFHQQVLGKIQEAPPAEQQIMMEFLTKARRFYEREQRKLQRFIRRALRSLLTAIETGLITLENESLVFDPQTIKNLDSGTAILMYIEANKTLVAQLLQPEYSSELKWLKYYTGNDSEPPNERSTVTSFAKAIREYVGTPFPIATLFPDEFPAVVPSVGQTPEFDFFTVHAGTQYFPNAVSWQLKDGRSLTDTRSVYHSMVAETLALAYTYRRFFETADFFEDRKMYGDRWKTDPVASDNSYRFPPSAERRAYAREMVRRNAQTPSEF